MCQQKHVQVFEFGNAAIKVNWDSNIAIIQIPPSILLISYRKRVCNFYLEKINVIYLKVK